MSSPMTPTEQDKELREAIANIVEAEYKSPNYTPVVERIDHIMQLITADRKRVALEARIDELEQVYPQLQKHHGVSGEGNYYYDDRIAELKAQQEEFGDN